MSDDRNGTYRVIVDALPSSPGDALLAIRLAAGLELRTAKDLHGYLSARLPSVLVDGVSREKAVALAGEFNKRGGEARVEESVQQHPVVLYPAVLDTFELGPLRQMRRR